jgi:formate/nitrite transporter
MSKPEFTSHRPVAIAAAVDALTSVEIARRIEAVSIDRARLPLRSLICLGVLGGLYIGFGGALATLVLTDNTLGFGLARLTAGVAFSLGLILLVVGGGELFTGNNLMVVAYAGGKASLSALLRNWGVVFAANAAGGVLLALVIHYSGVLQGGGVEASAVRIAEAKAQLGASAALLRGVLCNALVCLAVWLSVAARSVEGKVLAIVFPIGAFVALGFEHCVANLYLLPAGMLAGANVGLLDVGRNIGLVALGNTLGGAAVGLAYWAVHLRGEGAPRLPWRATRTGQARQALRQIAGPEAAKTGALLRGSDGLRRRG